MGDWYWNNRKGGGGAPVRDSSGNAVPNIKVALRGGRPSNQVSPTHGQAGNYDTRLAPESPTWQRHESSFREHPSPNVHMASLALMNGADLHERHEKRLRQQSYQQELQQQIEEKSRRKAQEKAERERLEYEDMLRYERQLAQDKAREQQQHQQQQQQSPQQQQQQQQQSMSRTDTFVLNNTNHSNMHNETPESAFRSTSVQPTRTLVRASSESNIPAYRQASDNHAHTASDGPPRAPHRERRNGRLDADMLDFVRSAAVRTSEGMVMISADLFEKLLGRCEDLLASHAQLERQCQEQHNEQHRRPVRRDYDGDLDNDVGARDDESVVNSVTEERERLAYEKALARTRAKQEARPTRSQSQNSARPSQKAAANGSIKQSVASAPAAKRGASQPPAGRKSDVSNRRSATSAKDAKAQRTGVGGTRKLGSTATGAGASRRQTGAKEAVYERARKPGHQSSSVTKEAVAASPQRRGDKLPNLRNPPKLNLNDSHPSSKAPRARVGTPGTELQAESSLLYLPPDNDADYIGEDQLDVLLRNARATRNADREVDFDYRGMS